MVDDKAAQTERARRLRESIAQKLPAKKDSDEADEQSEDKSNAKKTSESPRDFIQRRMKELDRNG